MRGTARFRVVIVVPAFSVADQPDQPIVSALIMRLESSVAPEVGDRIDRPGNVPDGYGAHEDAPNQPAEAELQGAPYTPGAPRADQGPGAQEHRPLCAVKVPPHLRPLEPFVETILEQVAGITVV